MVVVEQQVNRAVAVDGGDGRRRGGGGVKVTPRGVTFVTDPKEEPVASAPFLQESGRRATAQNTLLWHSQAPQCQRNMTNVVAVQTDLLKGALTVARGQ